MHVWCVVVVSGSVFHLLLCFSFSLGPTCTCRYDPHTNKWTEVAPMAKRRAGVGLAALNGFLYAVGGFDDASPLDTVER